MFELARVSKHRFRWTAIKKSPHALANSIPPSFDILPWQRARFGNPQDPTNPPLKIEPFCLTDLAHPTRKVRELEITALDVVPPDEWAKTQAKIREAKERAAAGKLAPPPPQPHEEVQPAPLPDPEKKPGDLAVTEIVSDPRNYGPKVRVAGGVPPISPSGRVGQVPLTATVDEIPVLAAIRNGKHPHPTNGKKGGAA